MVLPHRSGRPAARNAFDIDANSTNISRFEFGSNIS
jgi:hypothetical protein